MLNVREFDHPAMSVRRKLDGVALLLVDIQYDFIDGSLAVPGAVEIIEPIRKLLAKYDFEIVILSQDYHPDGHVSFASSHPGGPGMFQEHMIPHPNTERARKGETVKQMLWPDHCIQGTHGADIQDEILACVDDLKQRNRPIHLVQKGTERHIDGYSAFADNQYLGFTDLARVIYRHTQGDVHTLVVVGLATDYCVKSSAIDARKFKLNTILIEEAMRGVASDSTQSALNELRDWGARVIRAVDDLENEVMR